MGWNSSAMFTVECLIAQTISGRNCCAGNWGEGSGVETVDGL